MSNADSTSEASIWLLPKATDRIPVLPPSVPYLLQALQDDEISFGEMANVIENVPSVAARLLSLANSAWSSPASPVTTLGMACSRLGLRVVRSASIALAVSQPFNPARCPPFKGHIYWGSALLNAEAAWLLASDAVPQQANEARTAALLCNLGLIWLADILPKETGQALLQAEPEQPGRLDQLLSDTCGIGYIEAGARLAEVWNLPPPLLDAIAEQYAMPDDASPLTYVVSTASGIVSHVRRDLEWQPDATPLDRLRLDSEQIDSIVRQVERQRADKMDMAEALFPGSGGI